MPCRDIATELGPIGGERRPEAIEHLWRNAVRIAFGTDHHRQHRANQHGLGNPARLSPSNITGDLVAARRMANMDRVPEIERLHQLGNVGRVCVHLDAAIVWLERPWRCRSWTITR